MIHCPVHCSGTELRVDNFMVAKLPTTVNVGTLVGRSAEVKETVVRKRAYVVTLQEVSYRNQKRMNKKLKRGDFY